jgi:hypothetical protein
MNPTLMADYMIEISTSAEEIRKGVETSEGVIDDVEEWRHQISDVGKVLSDKI